MTLTNHILKTEKPHLKVLFVDAGTGFYRIGRYELGKFWGPIDLGIHLAKQYDSLNIGAGLLAGSIFPGSNRLFITGFSPCWHGFYISSLGGAALVFDNLGINMLAIVGKAANPSILYLNRNHGEEIEVEIRPARVREIWDDGNGGFYGLMHYTLGLFGERYENDPRVLATGPAALFTDFGAIGSAPVRKKQITHADTWAGRGGMGSKMLQQHGIASVIYGGTYVNEDFRDRNVADGWFQDHYQKTLIAKDMEATTKYRYDPVFNTGGTFGVNYATVRDYIMAFNYRTIYWDDSQRLNLHEKFIINHYLKQFNEETIATKQQKNCGEPCAAVCKKLNGQFKKDYEPYQTMGPLIGVFDQRAAEMVNHSADSLGFDAISDGGVLAWLMDCLDEKLLDPEDLGVKTRPVFGPENFNIVNDSMHNANLAVDLLNEMAREESRINLKEGARKFARNLARERNRRIMDLFVHIGFARHGWMVPNQYWTPGALSPMSIMGKYYMYYGKDFVEPRELGRQNANRMLNELIIDNLGICRFHRAWAEELMPDIVEKLFGGKELFMKSITLTASRIHSRNASIFWESEKSIDYVYRFLKKKLDEDNNNESLKKWVDAFEDNKQEAALAFWYEVHKGAHERLREF
jgi:glyceraldehyde-3-phosphate dehydrogenase (ferredoxin)